MAVGFNFNINLTYRLKPQVSGIKSSTVYRRRFPRRLAHVHFDYFSKDFNVLRDLL